MIMVGAWEYLQSEKNTDNIKSYYKKLQRMDLLIKYDEI
jgi:hypothetical protein